MTAPSPIKPCGLGPRERSEAGEGLAAVPKAAPRVVRWLSLRRPAARVEV